MINLKPEYLEMVKQILTQHVPEYKVFAFGSRVSGRAWEFSDLDLVIMTDHTLSFRRLSQIREAFSESDLPIKVDIVDWAALDDNFRSIVQQGAEIIKDAE